ncbi:MAG: type II toxin-antitoxin system RelE/ParE family toxin [Phormidesmis sp.]
MPEIRKTDAFTGWFETLRDRRAKARIQVRIDRLELGTFGQVSPVGEGVSELKIPYGPGYRVYFVQKGSMLVILLCGGDKSSQPSDIKKAKALAGQLKDK